GLFDNRRKTSEGKHTVPVWFMRQAGRYHAHYRKMKESHDFISLCKSPELAAAVTMGPIEEFDFDAAILFSDLLFPLEQMNMGLKYDPGPKLDWNLTHSKQLSDLIPKIDASSFYHFQGKACKILKSKLAPDKTLLGFVGAPFTLFTYAVEGGHAGALINTKKGLAEGLSRGFWEILLPNLLEEMSIQAANGAEVICLFDTAAGELDFCDYQKHLLPPLRNLTSEFKSRHPDTRLLYYSKHTTLQYLKAIECEHIDVLAIDWRIDLTEALNSLGRDYYIQGNLDPVSLHLPWKALKAKLDHWHKEMDKVKISLDRFIASLGHGVLPGTPEQNVKQTVEYIQKKFIY
ncbi:MAG: hypothetical protein OXB84_07505, partial [Halobacteriovoraceae bacterium]|nr:hypothetical protein [Halobacteriovoraceae bacterium]